MVLELLGLFDEELDLAVAAPPPDAEAAPPPDAAFGAEDDFELLPPGLFELLAEGDEAAPLLDEALVGLEPPLEALDDDEPEAGDTLLAEAAAADELALPLPLDALYIEDVGDEAEAFPLATDDP